MSNSAAKKKAEQALLAAFDAWFDARMGDPSASTTTAPQKAKPAAEPKVAKAKAPKAKAPKVKAEKTPKTPKAKKAPGTLKEHAEAAIAEGKFKGNTKEGKLLASYIALKDLRSAEARTMAADVATTLGLPAPKKPGPAPKTKAEKTPKTKADAKAEKKSVAPKAKSEPPKAKAEKTPKAPKAGGTLKDQAKAALEAKKVKAGSKDHTTLKEFIESKADGRSQEARTAAIEVCRILGLPPPKKPGPAPKEKAPKAAAPKKAKASPQGKGETDAAESPTPSPSQPTGVKPPTSTKSTTPVTTTKPRAVEAVETIMDDAHKSMNTAMVLTELEKRGWYPESADPKSYVYFILSNNKDKFEKDPDMPKGFYRRVGAVTNGASKSNGHTASAPEAPVSEPPEAEAAAEESEDLPAATSDENPFDDEILGEP